MESGRVLCCLELVFLSLVFESQGASLKGVDLKPLCYGGTCL